MKSAIESPKWPPRTCSGTAGAIARSIKSGMVVIGVGHIAVAAGKLGFKILPSGMITSSGLKEPSLLGWYGVVMILKPYRAAEMVDGSGVFIGPMLWGLVPVKSTIIFSSSTVILSFRSNFWLRGASSLPSPSSTASAE